MNQALDRLKAELAQAHRESLRGAALTGEVERRLRAHAERLPGRKARTAPVFALMATAAVAAIALVTTWQRRDLTADPTAGVTVPALAFEIGAQARTGHVGDAITATNEAAEARFSDGSRLWLAPGGRARVTAVDGDGAAIDLQSGQLDASITHRPRTRWHVMAGGYSVRVVGTRFITSWDPTRGVLAVRLLEGAVEVSGPGVPVTKVSAGERLDVVVDATGAKAQLATGGPAGNPAVVMPSAHPGEPQDEAAPVDEEAAKWRALAAAGHYREALAAVAGDRFAALCQSLAADDVIWLGDVARLAGDAPRATQAYRAALDRFPRLDRASFGLGVVAFDVQRDYAAAAQWFMYYLNDHPDGALAAEASGRLLESRHRAGDRTGARAAATAYLRDHPAGAHAGLARQVLSP